tara:strand:+ start:514 stop:735 length:222 start_codon:yes stop_codon:yes gene_type:complete
MRIRGTYGSQYTECVIFVHGNCYAVQGSKLVNVAAHARDLIDGVHVEYLSDVESFEMKTAIETEQDLVDAIDA